MMKSATVNSTGSKLMDETAKQKENKQMALQMRQQKHNVSKVNKFTLMRLQ